MNDESKNKLDEMDLEIQAIFEFLKSIPEELFAYSIPLWRRVAWVKEVEVPIAEYNQLETYGEQITQRASHPSLLFVHNYFKFKKEMSRLQYERIVSLSLGVILVSGVCITFFLLTSNEQVISITVTILGFTILSLLTTYFILVVRRNFQEFQLFSKLELLLEIAQKKALE